jgi:hypothetical protein
MTLIQQMLSMVAEIVAFRPTHATRRNILRALLIVLVFYVIGSILALISTQRAANSLFGTGIASTLAEGSSELNRLQDKLDVFERRFQMLKVWAFPVHQVARVIGVVPVVGEELQATELLLERVEGDLKAAGLTLTLARYMFELRETTLSSNISISDSDQLGSLRGSFEGLKASAQDVLAVLEPVAESSEQIDSLSKSSLITSLSARMTTQEMRLLEVVEFSSLLSDVILGDTELVTRFESTFDEVRGFQQGTVSLEDISDLIGEMTTDAEVTRDNALLMAETAPEAVLDSGYGELVLTLRDMNVAMYGLISGIDTILSVMGASMETLMSSEEYLFQDGIAITEMLQTLVETEDELSASARLIEDSIAELLDIDDSSSISIGALGDVLEDRTEPLVGLSEILVGAPRVAAEIFGIDGSERRYLMLGQTSDEIRAAGGFTSSAWLLTFRGGALVGRDYLDVTLFEDPNTLGRRPAAFDELQLHMDAGLLYLRDVGWSPHFPAVGKLAADIYEIGHTRRVNGVISLTQWALIDIATAIGGIETTSGVVSDSDLLSAIETGTDEEGTGYLASLFDSLLDSMTGTKIQAHGVDLLTTIKSLVEQKDLMIYSENPKVQTVISEIGWDGGLSNSTNDRLAIVDSNVGWNKVDRNIERKYEYELNLTDVNEPHAKLKLSYTNGSSGGDNCEMQTLVSRSYEEFLHGCYWNYLRVYVPAGTQLIEGDDLALEAGSIAARVSEIPTGSRTVRQMFDDDGDYVSGLMALPPQSSVEIELNYKLPKQVIKKDGNLLEYSLGVFVQAGIRDRIGTLNIKLPAGYEVVEVQPLARINSKDLITIDFDPSKNESIRLLIKELSGSAG